MRVFVSSKFAQGPPPPPPPLHAPSPSPQCRFLEGSPGRCLISFPVRDPAVLCEHVHGRRLHPGFLATLIDCAVTCVQVEDGHRGFRDVRARIGTSVDFKLR